MRDRALHAIDEAFADVLKREFEALVGNYAGGEQLEAAIGRFSNGLHKLKAAHEHATAAVNEVFHD